MTDRDTTRVAMTANQTSEAIQNSYVDESAAIEREQNQMFSAPSERAAENNNQAE